MRHLFASVLILGCVLLAHATPPQEPKLPETWTKDFVITLSFTGSMDGSSTHIVLHSTVVNMFTSPA